MENFFTYSWKVALLVSLCWTFYRLFLANNTLFEYKRFFLVSGLLVSVLLPLFYIHQVETLVMPTRLNSESPSVVSAPTNITEETQTINWYLLLFIIYISGVIVCLLKFFIQFYSLLKIISSGERSEKDGLRLVEIKTETKAFSFLRTIVYNPTQYSAEELGIVLTHEKIHARELHTLDILLAELFICFQWFNPFAWLYKKNIIQNLEFLTDQKVIAAENSKELYQLTLLKSSMNNAVNLLANQFHHSFIKKRIFMLNKNRTTKFSMLKTLILIPFLALFLVGFNFKKETKFIKTNVNTRINEKVQDSVKEEPINVDFQEYIDLINKTEYIEFNGNRYELTDLKDQLLLITTFCYYSDKDGDKYPSAQGQFISDAENTQNGIIVYITEKGKAKLPDRKKEKFNSQKIVDKNKPINARQTPNENQKIASALRFENSKPLVFINGKKSSLKKLNTLNKDHIEKVNILKDEEAIKKYGKKAKDGVILVTIK